MSGPVPLLPGVRDPESPAAQILAAATAAITGLPAVVLDRAMRAWAQLVTAEAAVVLWSGPPDAHHLDRLTLDTHLERPRPRPRSVAAWVLDVRWGAGGCR